MVFGTPRISMPTSSVALARISMCGQRIAEMKKMIEIRPEILVNGTTKTGTHVETGIPISSMPKETVVLVTGRTEIALMITDSPTKVETTALGIQ